jgi:hypothetical protein
MKKFLINLGLFLLVACAMTAAISLANKYFIINAIYNPHLFRLGTKDSLAVGASDIEFSLSPEIIKNSCNVACPAENYFYSYYKLRFILKGNPQIKTVILGFGYPGLTQASGKDLYGGKAISFYDRYFMLLDGEGRKTVSGFNRYYLVSLAKFHYGLPVEFYKQTDLLWRVFFNTVDITTYPFWGGFQKDMDFFKKIPRQKVDSTIVRHYYIENKMVEKSDVLINYLMKIVSLCREKKLRLILLKTPLMKEYFDRVPDYYKRLSDETLNRVKTLYPSVEYYDYNSFSLPDDHFIDCDHLNRKGADMFSAQLNRDIFPKAADKISRMVINSK